MEPNEQQFDDYPVLVSIEEYDRLHQKCTEFPRNDWPSYWASCCKFGSKFFESVQVSECWVVDNSSGTMIPAVQRGFAARLLALYDRLLNQAILPSTLSTILTPRTTPPKVIEDPSMVSRKPGHWGQMGNQYHLSFSQRVSLALTNAIGPGEVMVEPALMFPARDSFRVLPQLARIA